MIQQTTLFNAFIGTLPQKEAMMAEPGEEGKQRAKRTGSGSRVFAISAAGLDAAPAFLAYHPPG